MAARKLQTEIDRTLKKVSEGVELFGSIYDKMQSTTNQAQKEKLETDLKTQIKKLQRLRDQIKAWVAGNDIKDKSVLMDNRRLIETQMEKFKACEKEMKTKAFSKEGLIAAQNMDPKEREKAEVMEWIFNVLSELQRQIEQTEAEIASAQVTERKKKRTVNGKAEELEALNSRRSWHVGRLEIILLLVNNGSITPDNVNEIKDDVQYFVESNIEEDFEEYKYIYDELNLDDKEYWAVGDEQDHSEDEQEDEQELLTASSSVPATNEVDNSRADVGSLITWISAIPISVDGGFGDVFTGTHSDLGTVALKRPRTILEDFIKRFQREAAMWERLQHPHILKYLGTFKRDGYLYIVSPFMKNGTLLGYISLHPTVNRIKLLCEAADAICYIHAQDIVHGDIKAKNLLVGDNGQVLLCDFGLTKPIDSGTSTAMQGAGSLRWQSPELLDGASKSLKSDVYAFGMTIAEILTGNIPYPDLRTDGAVFNALFNGRRPPKDPAMSSTGLSYERVWMVAEACWSKTPEGRISMDEALRLIQEDLRIPVIDALPVRCYSL